VIVDTYTTKTAGGKILSISNNTSEKSYFDYNGDLWINGVKVDPTGGSTPPAGSDTFVQYNNAGAFGAVSTLTYDGNFFNAPRTNINGPGAGSTALNIRMFPNGDSTVGTLGDETRIQFYGHDDAGSLLELARIIGVTRDPTAANPAGELVLRSKGTYGDAELIISSGADNVWYSPYGDINLWSSYVEIGPPNSATGTPSWTPNLEFRGFEVAGISQQMCSISALWRDGTGTDTSSAGLNIYSPGGIDVSNGGDGGFIGTTKFYSGSAGTGSTIGAIRLSSQARPNLSPVVNGVVGDGVQMKSDLTHSDGNSDSYGLWAVEALSVTPASFRGRFTIAVADGAGNGASVGSGPRMEIEKDGVHFDDGSGSRTSLVHDGIVIHSPNGTPYLVTVADDGTLTTTEVV
jgi:hypothetical protein